MPIFQYLYLLICISAIYEPKTTLKYTQQSRYMHSEMLYCVNLLHQFLSLSPFNYRKIVIKSVISLKFSAIPHMSMKQIKKNNNNNFQCTLYRIIKYRDNLFYVQNKTLRFLKILESDVVSYATNPNPKILFKVSPKPGPNPTRNFVNPTRPEFEHDVNPKWKKIHPYINMIMEKQSRLYL